MEQLARSVITTCWIVFLVVWVLAAISTKRTVYSQSSTERSRYMIPVGIGSYLVFRRFRPVTPFGFDLIPHTDAILIAAAILCACGLGFCVWARAVLGRNWSGMVTLKENHELIVRGPYRLVRHPIYTGLLAMLIATWITRGHLAGLIGLLIAFTGIWIKSSAEEELMVRQFPDQYAIYRSRVKRFVPFLL